MSPPRRAAAYLSVLALLANACSDEGGSASPGSGGAAPSTGGVPMGGSGGASAGGSGGVPVGGCGGAGGSGGPPVAPAGGSGGAASGGAPGGMSGDAGAGAVPAAGAAGIPSAAGAPAMGGSSAAGAPAGGTGGDPGPPVTFRNPLNPSHGSDPWMIYYQGYYYLAATTWGTTLTMKRGRTIQELKDATPVVIWDDSTPSRCCNNWAPEFYLIDGPNGLRWYHYYTAGDGNSLDTQRSHVLESEGTDPMGPYHYQGRLIDYWAIDGSILEVGANRYFMFSTWEGGTQNVYLIAMTNPWTVTGNRLQLTSPEYAWEQEGSDSVNEGPEPLYHDGRIFVTYSASQCADAGYKLGLLELTGSDPLAAASWWKSPVPVFQAANGAYGSAHNGFFVSPDGTENWLVYHATTNPSGSCWTDRTTRIQPFGWSPDGTPDFGVPLSLDTDLVVPSGE